MKLCTAIRRRARAAVRRVALLILAVLPACATASTDRDAELDLLRLRYAELVREAWYNLDECRAQLALMEACD